MDDEFGNYLPQYLREDVWAIRCVACNGPISGYAHRVFISRYEEYCPWCLGAISKAEAEERAQRREERKRERRRASTPIAA